MTSAVNLLFPALSVSGKTGRRPNLTGPQKAQDPFAALLALFGRSGEAMLLDPGSSLNGRFDTNRTFGAGSLQAIETDSQLTEKSNAGQEKALFPLSLSGQMILPEGEAAPVELLFDQNGSDPALVLRIANEDFEALPELAGANETESSTDTLLPVRLRTVEQVGGRWIVTADLADATEKTQQVRIRLDLVRPHVLTSTQLQSAGRPNSPDRSAHDMPSLVRLLHGLRAQALQLESAAPVSSGSNEAAVEAVQLPFFAIRQLRINNFQRTGGRQGTSAAATQPGATINAESFVSGTDLASLKTTDKADMRFGQPERVSGSKESDATGQFTELWRGRAGTNPEKSGRMFPIEFAAVDGRTANTATTPAATDTGLRFYDIDDKLQQLLRSPGQKIHIQLMPPKLGQMQVSISTWRGAVTIKLVVESEQARALVEKNFSHLEQKLTAAGIKVDGYHLDVQHPGRQEAAHGNQRFDYFQGQNNHGRSGGHQRQAAYRERRQSLFGSYGEDFEQAMLNYLA